MSCEPASAQHTKRTPAPDAQQTPVVRRGSFLPRTCAKLRCMTGLVVFFCVLLGLAIGSFLNVVIYRVPAGESVVHPPSKCPNCGAAIRNRHNVPVLGWLLLRGKCAD